MIIAEDATILVQPKKHAVLVNASTHRQIMSIADHVRMLVLSHSHAVLVYAKNYLGMIV
jgi:hypothetical protein